MLSPSSAHSVGLIMHELATNAAKYGALSNATGRIEISWGVVKFGERDMARLEWSERGGPEVCAPGRKGFGSRLIETSVAHSLGGEASSDLRPNRISGDPHVADRERL